METGKQQETENALVQSHVAVRQSVGAIGLMLPVVLWISGWFFVSGHQTSISGYYHTPMGDVLVGALVCIGIFLATFKGYKKEPGERMSDRYLTVVAGITAIMVALFPVGNPEAVSCNSCNPPQGFIFHPEAVHLFSAGVFFFCLALLSIFQFTRGDRINNGPKTNFNTPRNMGYITYGIIILLALDALAYYFSRSQADQKILDGYNFVFWVESIGVWAFAISWLAKGRTLIGINRVWGRLKAKVSR